MRFIINISLSLTCILFCFVACKYDKDGFAKTDKGLRYKIINSNQRMNKPELGDILVLDIIYKNSQDEVIFSSNDIDRKYLRKLTEAKHPGGSLEDALAMMHTGDSMIFKINAANFYKFSEEFESIPSHVLPEDDYIFYIKLKEILKQDNFNDHLVSKYHDSEETEMKLLEAYLEKASIQNEPSASGLYYIERKNGIGEKIKTGDLVEIYYTGKFIDGQIFDTNYGKKPLQFRVGFASVIRGLDEGIKNMKKGGEALLIIPSKLAYGAGGAGEIKAYSTLIFEIEVVNVY